MKVLFFTNAGSRKKNEDSLLIHDQLYSSISMETFHSIEIHSKTNLIFGIADGIGGRPGGEIASNLSLEIIKKYKHLIFKKEYSQLLEKIFIYFQNYQKKHPELEGMGTTISVLGIQGDYAYIFHIGDTRIYSFNEQNLTLLTRDHTHVQDLVDRGFLKHEDIAQHPMRNYLKSAITTNIDINKLEYHANSFPLNNTNFFLCSDGIWETFPDKKLKQILTKENSPEKKANKIIKKCIEINPSDNFSFIMIM